MEIADEDFNDEFSIFGVTIESTETFDKLRYLCQLHRIDASEVAAEWVAFAHTNKGCKITSDTLDQLERDRLQKKSAKAGKTPKNAAPRPNLIHNITSLQEAVEGEGAGDLLQAYSTPQSKSKKRQHTPDSAVNKRLTGIGRSPAVPFSPASFSPTAAAVTPSRKYSSRANAGDAVCTFGALPKSKWRSGRNSAVDITAHDPSAALSKRFKYMFQKLADKAAILNEQLDELGEELRKQHKIEDDLAHLALPSQEEITVVGRVCCDSNGKLNSKSVLLEGSRTTSAGKQIAVDLSQLHQYSLFPGQVVMMRGINSTGNKFVARHMYEGVPRPLPEKPPTLGEPLSVVVATGPFTTSDSIMYEPLADLIKHLIREQPDVAILMGPFVDMKNPETEKSIVDFTYEEFFKSNIIEQIVNSTERLSTQLVIVPSFRDIHHDPVYPQPPFSVQGIDNKRVHFVSDPCTLDIEGITFGITSSDVLFHLGAEEISSPPAAGDRLARLTQHLLTQQSYYPLYPSHEDVNVDFDHYDVYGRLPVTPHVMIVPSDLRYFIKDVNGCCCINPGRLAKGQVGGTFSRLHIKPILDSNTRSIVPSVAAEVLRI